MRKFFLKRVSIPVFICLTAALFFICVPQTFASPPTSPYAPGETRDPTCSPGGANCTVTAPAASGANSDITSLSGLTTALSAAQGGTGQLTYTKGDLLVASSTTSLAKLTVGSDNKFLVASSTAPYGVAWDTIASAGGGITSLAGLTGTTQTFATSTDTNLGIEILSTGTSHTFTPTWIGTLADDRISSASTWNGMTSSSTQVIAGTGLSGGGTLTGNVTLNNAGVLSLGAATGTITLTTPLTMTSGVLSMPTSTASVSGFLTSTDWDTFNNKQNQLWGLSGSYLFASSTSWLVGIGTASPSEALTVAGGLFVGTSTIPTLYVASTTGRVGIGTSTPAQKLHLQDGTLLIDRPAAPTLGGTYDTIGTSTSVYVSGKYAYVADSTSGLQIIDVSNPAAPTLTGTYNTSGNAYGVYVSGKYAYVADGTSGLQIIDVSNPAAPTLTGTYNTTGYARGVYVSGKYAYVADSASGLQIIDVSNPAAPTLTGTYDTSGDARGVYVSGKYAYVADYASGLQIIDVSNPAAPTLTGTYNTSGNAYGVYVSGKYAYVGDGTSGLQIIDVSNPAAPTLTGTYDTTSTSTGVYVSGKYAYVADSASGLQIIDVSNPAAPTLTGTYDTSGNAYGVYVSGKYAYVADGTSGLQIIDIKGADIHALSAGNISTNDLTAWENIDVGDSLYVRNGLNVGPGGLLSQGSGDFSIFATSSLSGIYALSGALADNNSSSLIDVMNLIHMASSSAANNIGTGLLFSAEDVSGFATSTGRIGSILTNVSTSSPASVLTFSTKPSSGSLTEWMRLDQNGNIGIGTTTPPTILSISSSSPAISLVDTQTSGKQFRIRSGGVSAGVFDIYDNASTTSRLTIDSGGNVGIGTSAPQALLEIYSGSQSFNALSLRSGAGEATEEAKIIWNHATSYPSAAIGSRPGSSYDYGDLRFYTATNRSLHTTPDMIIDTNGNVGIGDTSPNALLEVSASGGASDLFMLSSNDANNGNRLIVKNSGNVGIGTTTPTSLLELFNATTSPILTITAATSGTAVDPYVSFRTGAAPATKFVMGVDYSDSNKFKIATSTIGTNDAFVIDQSGVVDIGVGSTYALVTDLLGRVGVGTTTPATQLQVVGTSTTWAIIPEADNTYSLGVSGTRWSNIFAASSTVGDLIFGNEFRIVEDYETPQALIFKNQKGEEIMRLDENGNMILAGSITSSSTQASSTQLILEQATSTESILAMLSGFFEDLAAKVKEILASLGLAIENGIAYLKELIADRITTKELCIDDVCINKAQLKELLEKNQMTAGGGSDGGDSEGDSGSDCQLQTFYFDADADGFGNLNNSTSTCEAPAGYVSDGTDCDDANQDIHENCQVVPPPADEEEGEGEEEPVCDSEHLDLCITQELCEGVSLYWYDESCNSEPEIIPDIISPIITLLGDATINIDVGDAYVDPGATATDDVDGDISANIAVVNSVDAGAVGTYTVTYNVNDAAGNAATEVGRTVNVVALAPAPTPVSTSTTP